MSGEEKQQREPEWHQDVCYDRRASDTDIALLRQDLEGVKQKLKQLSEDVEALVNAWKAANTVVVFVKWIAGAITAVGIIWIAIKGMGKS